MLDSTILWVIDLGHEHSHILKIKYPRLNIKTTQTKTIRYIK
jgi:hypothetical protein